MDFPTPTIFFSTFLCLYILFNLIKFLHKVWWKPIQIQNMLKSQEITGPPYKFLHGNTKEALNMIMGSLSKPMEHLSHDIMPKVQPHFHSWIKMYGRTVLSWHGSKPQLIITDPDLIKEVLNNKNGVYLKVKAEGFIRKLLGDGLVTSEGKKWAKQRKLANHAFHAENLKRMIPVMLTSLEMMLERWTRYEGNEIDVFEEFKITTSDAISRTAFGSSYLEGIKIFEDLTKLTALVAANSNRIRLPGSGKFVRTSDEIESDKLEHGIRESFIQIIRRREEKMKMEESNEYSCDYLGFLVKAYQDTDDNKKISIEDMIDECKTFYLAGHETVTSLVTWTVLLLAIHTDWQEKARMEVNELSVGNESTPDFNTIAKLKTMTMIINETLRLYPPALSIFRRVSREIRLGKLLLPANIDLIIPTIVTHNDPKIWGEDVHLFKPDRFAEGVTKAAKNPMAYLPFGLGPRACVGINFAMTEAKLVLAMILQRYAFTLSPTYVHSPYQRLITLPQHGVQIILHAL